MSSMKRRPSSIIDLTLSNDSPPSDSKDEDHEDREQDLVEMEEKQSSPDAAPFASSPVFFSQDNDDDDFGVANQDDQGFDDELEEEQEENAPSKASSSSSSSPTLERRDSHKRPRESSSSYSVEQGELGLKRLLKDFNELTAKGASCSLDYDDRTCSMQFPLQELAPLTLSALNLESDGMIEVVLNFQRGYCIADPHGKLIAPLFEVNEAEGLNKFLMHSIRDLIIELRNDTQLDKNSNMLIIMYDFLQHRIVHCTRYCVSCKQPHNVDGVKLVPCNNDDCLLKFSEWGLGSSPDNELLKCPDSTDLLISLVYMACNSSRKDDIFHPFPEAFIVPAPVRTRDYAALAQVLALIPSVDEMIQEMRTSNISLKKVLDRVDSRAYHLFRWILFTNRAFLTPVTVAEINAKLGRNHIPHTVKQAFAFVSGPPEQKKRFLELKTAAGRSKVVFHGSAGENWHRIFRESLKVMSNTSLMRNGAVHGKGIYYGKDFQTSSNYSTYSSHWCKSRLSNTKQIMLVGELVTNEHTSDIGWCYVVNSEDNLSMQYLVCY